MTALRVIDTETTGLHPSKGAEVIQIASLDLFVTKTEAGAFEVEALNPQKTFVKPSRPIPPETSAVHGIIDDDVKNAPTFNEAIQQFMGAKNYIAHNAAFDSVFLPCFPEANWICTMKLAKRVFPDAPNHKNQTLRYMLGIIRPFGLEREEINAHDALSDVYVTAGLFAYMIEHRLATFKDMVAWSSQPDVVTKWPVGKHKGVLLEHVDGEYLEWVEHKSSMDDGLKAVARQELKRRREPKVA